MDLQAFGRQFAAVYGARRRGGATAIVNENTENARKYGGLPCGRRVSGGADTEAAHSGGISRCPRRALDVCAPSKPCGAAGRGFYDPDAIKIHSGLCYYDSDFCYYDSDCCYYDSDVCYYDSDVCCNECR